MTYVPPSKRRLIEKNERRFAEKCKLDEEHQKASLRDQRLKEIEKMLFRTISNADLSLAKPVELVTPVSNFAGRILLATKPDECVTEFGNNPKEKYYKIVERTQGWLLKNIIRTPKYTTHGWGETSIHPERTADAVLIKNGSLYVQPPQIPYSEGWIISTQSTPLDIKDATSEEKINYPQTKLDIPKLKDHLLVISNNPDI